MTKVRVDEEDVLIAARQAQGLERMEQIKYAVLERSGGISIVPQSVTQQRHELDAIALTCMRASSQRSCPTLRWSVRMTEESKEKTPAMGYGRRNGSSGER